MNTHLDVYRKAQALGLTVKADGGDLVVKPRSKCPPEFVTELRQHKRELLVWLGTSTAAVPPDQKPWLHVARQVLAGEFDGADSSTVESLTIGLRGVHNPLCRLALERLPRNKEKTQ